MLESRWQAAWIVAAVLGLVAAAVTHAAEPPRTAPAGNSRNGTLEIIGKGIEKLVLNGPGGGHEQTLNRPGPSVSLPAGLYSVRQVLLQGGFEGRRPSLRGSFPDICEFTIVAGQSCRLKIGAPLTSTVTVKGRRGSVLMLDYAMVDAGGWQYFPRGRDDPPRFNIYRGDELVGSGSFKYG
jgi:hypothetical protein